MFQYSSSQVHEVIENGTKKQKRNTVNISNGSGTKTVEVTENGTTRKSTKKLSNAEIQKIQKNEFIPGLFKECNDCLKTSKGGSRSSRAQTRRSNKKKSRSRK